MITTLLSTALVLGVLIFVHELGHFLAARRLGVTVLTFSFGFGPRLAGLRRGRTDYRLSAVPLGGFVKMVGEDPDQEVPPEDLPGSFSHKSVWRRIVIVAAGPLANIVFAAVLFTGLYAVSGIPRLTTEIGAVNPGSPAEAAGLTKGDRVVAVDGKPVAVWDELSRAILEAGERGVTLTVRRGAETLTLSIRPEIREVKNIFGETYKRPIMGVTASGRNEITRVNPLSAAWHGLRQTWDLARLSVMTVVKLLQRVVPMETIGGPILIAQMAGRQAEEGFIHLLNFMGLISVNLAILNLLPIPILDGGHLFFFLIEAVRRKPVAMKTVVRAQQVGMVLLAALMVVVFYNDIVRLLRD